MATFLTPNRHGYSVYFSPFNPNQIAVATSQYFGLTGGGTLFILEINKNEINVLQTYQWTDGLFDCVWSEVDASQIITASGDGGLQLWGLEQADAPLSVFHEHKKEIYSIDWAKTRREQWFLSASWDCTIKIWDANRKESLRTFSSHSRLVYSAMFAPFIPNCFASVSGDGHLKLWSYNSEKPTTSFRVHDAEVLSCDWCKYDENLLATSGSDGLIRIWDIRNYTQPISQLKGGEYAVRRVKFSPHNYSILASVDYEFTTKIWDFKQCLEPLETIKHHSEFVYGLDWNTHTRGQLADCGWDSLVRIFSPRCLEPKLG